MPGIPIPNEYFESTCTENDKDDGGTKFIYVYCYGFMGGGNWSFKGRWLQHQFDRMGKTLHVLNLSRQIGSDCQSLPQPQRVNATTDAQHHHDPSSSTSDIPVSPNIADSLSIINMFWTSQQPVAPQMLHTGQSPQQAIESDEGNSANRQQANYGSHAAANLDAARQMNCCSNDDNDELECQRPEDRKLRIISSSFSAYIASLYASMYPNRVSRLSLLCPAFALTDVLLNYAISAYGLESSYASWRNSNANERTEFCDVPSDYRNDGPPSPSTQALSRWRNDNFLTIGRSFGFPFSLPLGLASRIPFALYEQARMHPRYPSFNCKGLIIQGRQDAVVAPSIVNCLIDEVPLCAQRIEICFVDDDHFLAKQSTLHFIATKISSFFCLPHLPVFSEDDMHLSPADEDPYASFF